MSLAHRLMMVIATIGICGTWIPVKAVAGDVRMQRGKVVILPRGGEASVSQFVTQQDEPADRATEAKLSWNDDGLTVTFHCEDDDVTAAKRVRDDPNMWRDDGVEIFLDPGHTHDYRGRWVHVLVSAAGSIYDESGPGAYSTRGDPYHGVLSFTAEGVRAETERTETGWRGRVFLPWEDVGGRPAVGDAWGMNLNRTDQPRERFLCWSPTFGSFLNIDQWGHIVFADAEGNAGDAVQRLEAQHTMLIERKQQRQNYVDRVTRGEGFMPWQARDRSSPEEDAFRQRMEARKDELLARRMAVRHPVLLSDEQLATARRNVAETQWGRAWFDRMKSDADHILAQDEGYIEHMIPALTPTNMYGFTCPNCVGEKSLEGTGSLIVDWDYRKPDVITCKACGQTYPDQRFPETAVLVAPRRDQTFTYYLNDAERAQPDDRSGRLAWKWVGHPVHMSFTGTVRYYKIRFMMGAARSMGLLYHLTGEERYARGAIKILERFAHCLPNWLYHDYWDTIADCDPLYAAWHGRELKIEWKRHLVTSAFERDEPDRAAMLQTFWGAGRTHASADTTILNILAPAYDLVAAARDANGDSLWTDEARRAVERDLLLEQLFTGEPFVGGIGKADNLSNKGPYVYQPMALVGRTLGVADFVHVALLGYEGLRDQSFLADGFSHESPAYTDMFLRGIIHVPDALDGFAWPEGFPGRTGVVSVFETDAKLRRIMRTAVESLAGRGTFLPLSDTLVDNKPSAEVFEIGLRRYPELFTGTLATIYRDANRRASETIAAADDKPGPRPIAPTAYAVFNHQEADLLIDDLRLPEIYFPAWMTAILRHGQGPDAAAAALSFNPQGNHRHTDNLGLFYADRGRTILAEQGYVGDSALLSWSKPTQSHNLVVVDDQEQLFGGQLPRVPSLRFMAATPGVSVVEAESRAYSQCTTYRRLVALLKGPQQQTILLDIFRVAGGDTHAYRVFSDLAASDAPGGAMELVGVDIQPPSQLPNFGGSVEREHVYGLRDVQSSDNPPAAWQAVWREDGRSYRLHMLAAAGGVAVSHGPGQFTYQQVGRRVRYLDVINRGKDVSSTFVAVHEPSGVGGIMPVISAERLDVPPGAGPDAVAVRLRTRWGEYLIFSGFDGEAEVGGVRFRGRFGVLATTEGRRWLMACGASTLKQGNLGFAGAPALWSGEVTSHTDTTLTTSTPRPEGWPALSQGVNAWVRVGDGSTFTGYPVHAAEPQRIVVEQFPLQPAQRFELPTVRYEPLPPVTD